jgi:hypothetical protein
VNKIIYFLYLFCFLIFQSCIEIIDDLTIHNDGSGKHKYAINLSSSRIKVNSILALDSLNGKKVPSISEIKEKIAQFKQTLSMQKGISSVEISENYVDFIFKFECDFTNLTLFQDGMKKTFAVIFNDKSISEMEFLWISFDSKTLKRSVPSIALDTFNKIGENDLELLKTGIYTSITRFDKIVNEFTNPLSKLSKDKKSLMLKTNTYSLKNKHSLLDNTINLVSN